MTVSEMKERLAKKSEELKIKQNETKEKFDKIMIDTDKARINK